MLQNATTKAKNNDLNREFIVYERTYVYMQSLQFAGFQLELIKSSDVQIVMLANSRYCFFFFNTF